MMNLIPIEPLQVVAFWSSFLGFLLVKFFQWSSLLSTWQGIIFTVLFMVIVTVVMEVLIHATQAERSKSNLPANLPVQDPIKQRLLTPDTTKPSPII